MAGTGKSTIARTLAHSFTNQKQLGASFFFSRGRGDLSHASKFFTSLTRQLAHTLPALKPFICEAIAEHFRIAQQGLSYQWKHLILKPLSRLKDSSISSKLVLVIDALDECEDEDDIRLVLQLLASARSLQNIRLRIFITSRPETPIRHEMYDMPEAAHQDFILHNISQEVIDHDISVYFQHSLEYIRQRYRLAASWPGEDTIKLLVRKSEGLFIYAATACRFIGEDAQFADSRLTHILQHDDQILLPQKMLDAIYTTVLMHSVRAEYNQQEIHDLCNQFRYVIGSIIILFDTLPATGLAEILQMTKESIDHTLTRLYSVLDIPDGQEGRVRLLHPSFRDFLLDERRCLNTQFRVDRKIAHQLLLTGCIRVMSKHLKRNICHLQSPGALAAELDKREVDKFIPLHIQYACRFWIYHLQQSYETCDCVEIHAFLQDHFLHWLEALAVIGCISDGVVMVEILDSMLAVSGFCATVYYYRWLISQGKSCSKSNFAIET